MAAGAVAAGLTAVVAGAVAGPVALAGEGPGATAIVAQLALLTGLACVFGGACGGLLLGQATHRPGLLPPAAWATAAGGLAGVAEIRRRAMGLGLGPFLHTPPGRSALWGSVSLAACCAALTAAGVSSGRGRRLWNAAVSAAAAGAMLTHVLSGHAAEGSGAPLKVAVQWAHMLAGGAWGGGLVALLLAIRGAPDADKAAAARRFSTLAAGALATLAATGVVRTLGEAGNLEALAGTTYGRLLAAKAALLLLLAALGARNRFRHLSVAERDLSGLRRVVALEIAVMLAAFAVTSVLAQARPAREAALRGAPGYFEAASTRPSAECAAASLASGTRNGEHDT
ncbi:MAG: CopD family protein [Acidobacteria bacterium]|nr:CopD family protein [Acidobacteriota bacterium]